MIRNKLDLISVTLHIKLFCNNNAILEKEIYKPQIDTKKINKNEINRNTANIKNKNLKIFAKKVTSFRYFEMERKTTLKAMRNILLKAINNIRNLLFQSVAL